MLIDPTHPRLDDLARLDGLIDSAVGYRLLHLAADVSREHAIVEVGSFKGKSTCYLAEGASLGDGAHVWAVDAWDLPGNPEGRHGFTDPQTRRVFSRQILASGLADRITPLCGFSTDVARAWKGPLVGLLFIDGSHLYRDVKADFEAWQPHLAARATVVFDDYRTRRNPGVTAYVDELAATDLAEAWELEPRPLAIARLP